MYCDGSRTALLCLPRDIQILSVSACPTDLVAGGLEQKIVCLMVVRAAFAISGGSDVDGSGWKFGFQVRSC